MATWRDFQENPEDNNAPPPVGAPEGGYQGRWVNDTFRYDKAAIRDLGNTTPKLPPGGDPEAAIGDMAYQSSASVNITGGTINPAGITGLGTAAARNIGTGNGNVPELDGAGRLAVARLPILSGATASGPGVAGIVPAPISAARSAFLAGDGGFRLPLRFAWEEWRETWANNTTYSFAHGLGARPDIVLIEFQAKSDNNGYSEGEVFTGGNDFQQFSGGSSSGMVIARSGSAVRYRLHSNGYQTLNFSNSNFSVTPASWRMRAVAILRYAAPS